MRTLDNDEVDLIAPLRRDNPENVKRVEFILSEENFDDLFPRRHSSYTYTRLLQVRSLWSDCVSPPLCAGHREVPRHLWLSGDGDKV